MLTPKDTRSPTGSQPDEQLRIFVASASESLRWAHGVQNNLHRDAIVQVWSIGVFRPSRTLLYELIERAERFDFAVFVFSPDDVVQRGGEGDPVEITRDNVLIEYGLFVATLGVERCFVLRPFDVEVHIPSDLGALSKLEYRHKVPDDDVDSAVGSASNDIRRALGRLGPRHYQLASRRDAERYSAVSAAPVAASGGQVPSGYHAAPLTSANVEALVRRKGPFADLDNRIANDQGRVLDPYDEHFAEMLPDRLIAAGFGSVEGVLEEVDACLDAFGGFLARYWARQLTGGRRLYPGTSISLFAEFTVARSSGEDGLVGYYSRINILGTDENRRKAAKRVVELLE